jgi:putative thiamine transport system permease protein
LRLDCAVSEGQRGRIDLGNTLCVRHASRALVAALFALPLVAALLLAFAAGADRDAWRALLADPQVPKALAASLRVALIASFVALAATLALATALHGGAAWRRLTRALGPMLAVPHAAFAIGFALLVMPSGLVARLLAPLFGWSAPPDWRSVNDDFGWALIAVLVAKETPFLLWSAFALFARPEVEMQLARQIATLRTLGYARGAAWWRVLWPQWLPRLALPLAAVLAYSLSVVDVALIIGPGAPPTLAVLAWQGLLDADPARNAEGAAATLLLALTLVALAGALLAVAIGLGRAWRAWVVLGRRSAPSRHGAPAYVGRLASAVLGALYALVLAVLVFVSLAGVWSFPALLPQSFDARAWNEVAHAARHVGFTAALAAAASASALLLALVWLEAAPPRWDRRAAFVVLLPLVVPALLLVVGLYRGALALRLDASVLGLWWVHTLIAGPYVWVALAPAWRTFDPRYEATALALGRARLVFWWRVKWPMLRAPLAAAAAVGFAVSVAQYLPTLFIGAGRHATVTTEAVTLAAGGQRSVGAAFALLQALLPALGFGVAHALTRGADPHPGPLPLAGEAMH